MDIFFTIRTVKQWNRLPQKIVQFPSSEVFKIQLDNDLSNLAWPQSWPYFEEEVRLENSWGPFQPKLALEPKTMKMNESQCKDVVGK